MKHVLIPSIICVMMACGCTKNKVNNNIATSDLEEWLAKEIQDREAIESLDFSKEALTKNQADRATALLFDDKQKIALKKYEQQWVDRVLKYGAKTMPFYYQIFGNEPADGRSLFISLHGGGGAPKEVNDQQYENQKHLYDETMKDLEGVYLAVRAPTNTWNLWHQDHIDNFMNIIIQMAVAVENVNPNKIYLLGYSAGGDGVYQLAPRMADRWAAASMMAGHPNDASPLGLKNMPFTIHMGALDAAYDRNKKAQEWKVLLENLEQNAPGTYIHEVQLHEGLGHWMKLQDAVALPWMKKYQRNPIPKKIVWKQDDRTHKSFYWLSVPEDNIENGGEIVVEYSTEQNELHIISNYSEVLQLRINDFMLNLDEPITVTYQGKVISKKTFERSIANIHESLSTKGDVELSFPCVITVLNNEIIQN